MKLVLLRSAQRCVPLLALLLLAVAPAFAQRATLTGRVTDANDGMGLPSANVVVSVQGTLDSGTGAATDTDGRYRIERLTAGTYRVQVRYIGYQDFTTTVTLAEGETRQLDVALRPGAFDLNNVVVSASRQAEQVLEAPASVSVLGTQEIQQAVTPSSVGAIRNEASVDMAQTGVDRQEVVLRGFNNAFSGATYVLVDYRQAAVPSLGVNIYSIMPNMGIDLERIEIVRGPGSALYGAGVDAGVVHFLTQDPFTNPGTAFSLSGGQQSLFGFEGRHAGVVGDKVGYKITAAYTRAEDFALDPDNSLDSTQLAADFTYANPSAAPDFQNVDPATGKLLRDNDYQKINVNGLVQYRLRPGVTLSLNGGYSSFSGTVLSGIGTLQGKDFGYTYGQVRLQAGSFFSQFYVNRNSAGESYVYGTGMSVVDNGMQYVGQAQYDWGISEKQRVIFGVDARLTRPDTEGTILGRNEEDDDITQAGVYAQSTSNLTSKIDLTLALRGDYTNVVDGVQLSPRAALVYKATPSNTFRVTYNRAFSSPGTNSLFLDIAGAQRTLSGDYRLIFQARGVRDGFTFNNFRQNNAVVPFLPVPPFFGGSAPVDAYPLLPVYAAGVSGALGNPQAFAALTANLNAAQRGALQQLLAYTLDAQGGGAQAGARLQTLIGLGATTDAGYLAFVNPATGQIDANRTVGTPTDIAPLKQTTTQTIELGYKGLLAEKLLVAVDGYYTQKNNFVGPLLVETPFLYLNAQELGGDVGQTFGALMGRITANGPQNEIEQQFAGAFNNLVGQFMAGGASQQQAAQQAIAAIAGVVAGAIGNPAAPTPVGVVQPDQAVLPGGNTATSVGAMLAYRNFGRIRFYGVDVALQFLATDRLNLFGNVSIVSDDFFDNEELGEENASLAVALNAPALKSKAGFSYVIPRGFSFNASGRYTDGFPVASGPYVGNVESYFLLDLGAGYDLGRFVPGMRLDVTVQNVLDNDHREFIGAPQIGRLGIARLSYSF